MRYVTKMFLGTAVLSASMLVATAPSGAKERCTEGRTASGVCVNPHLARLMRQQSIVMTQPKLSFTAPLVMPGDEEVILPPRQIYETIQLLPRGRYTTP